MHNLAREFIAEFIGTAILVTFGLSGSAQAVLTQSGSDFYPAISFGTGAFIAIFFCGSITGAHLNPAITVAFATIKKCDWRQLLVYLPAQYLGAFLATGIVYSMYFESVAGFDRVVHNSTGGTVESASIFVTFPSPYISLAPVVIDQVVSTALLAFAILFITDALHRTPHALQALGIGFALFTLVAGFNYNAGAPLNPARDLSPRVFLSIHRDYHKIVFAPLHGWFWLLGGVVGPHIGGLVGAWAYVALRKMRATHAQQADKYNLDSLDAESESSPEQIF